MNVYIEFPVSRSENFKTHSHLDILNNVLFLSSAPNSCGGTLTAEAAAKQFATANYPENYENSQICTWVISADAGKGIRLDVKDLELEDCFDTITIYEGE